MLIAIEGAPAALYREAGTDKLHYVETDTPGAWEIEGLSGSTDYEVSLLAQKLVPVSTTGKIKWHPDLFPDQLLFAYDADQMAGASVEWRPAGLVTNVSLNEQASKQPALVDGELRFAKNQFLLRDGTSFGATMFRGFIVLFQVNDPAGTGQAHICTINAAGGDYDTPRVQYKAGKIEARWDAQVFDGTSSSAVQSMAVACDGVIADGKTWNVAVVGRHDSYLFARLNGKLAIGPDRPWSTNNNTPGKTIIGPRADQGDTMGVTIKYLAGLQGELSEAWYRKAEDWGAVRVGRAPFHGSKPPVLEASDHPRIWRYDAPAFDKWVAENAKNSPKLREHAGKPALPLTGYTRVYLEDFRAKRLGSASQVNTFAPALFAQGGNPAVGGDPATKNPFLEDMPSTVYQQGDGKLSLFNEYRDGKWRSAATTSVSSSGHGRSWEGGYVLRWRDQYGTEIAGKLFWGRGWGYGLQQRQYHHLHRQEYDFNEPDAVNRFWGNMFSVHNHKSHLGIGEDGGHHKMIAAELRASKGWPADLDQWNGRVMDWEVRVDLDFTYLNIAFDNDGELGSNLIEWARFPTPPGFTERWFFMFNTCSKNTGTWEPDRAKRYGFDMHQIEVWQRDQVVNALPDAFAARPVLTRKGAALSVDPQLREPLDFVEYVWVGADGYQHGVTREPRFQSKDVARVLVRAIGATDLPEAWSNVVPAP